MHTSQPEKAIGIVNCLEKVVFSRKDSEEGQEAKIAESEQQLDLWKVRIPLVRRHLKSQF